MVKAKEGVNWSRFSKNETHFLLFMIDIKISLPVFGINRI